MEAFAFPESTILDIGAHFGYSVASIWSAGSASRVISFEPNSTLEPCFQRIAQLRPGRYEYWIGGHSDSPGSLTLAMPVINGLGIGALNTACAFPGVDGIATNLTDFFEKYFPVVLSTLSSFTHFSRLSLGSTICSRLIAFPYPPIMLSP